MTTNAIARTDFTTEQMQTIQAHFFPAGATKSEQDFCFSVARELGLNPILREIHFVPRRQKVGDRWMSKTEPMVGRDGFLVIAHRSGQLAGIESTATIRDTPMLEGGRWTVKPQLVASCTVWRKDSTRPFTAEVSYGEYVQCTADGTPTKFWSEKPTTMLKKVAESQALRKAFNVCGVYAPEELGAGYEDDGGNVEVTAQVIDAEDTTTERIEEPPRKATRRTRSDPEPPPEPVMDDGWPPEPAPRQQAQPRSTGQMTLTDVSDMLTAKGIKHEVDEECGYLSAKSYAHKDFLKSQGFTFDSEVKAWIWTETRRAA